MPTFRYELRIIESVDYLQPGMAAFWFTNGNSATIREWNATDKGVFPKGTLVVCRLQEIEKGKVLIGFARVRGMKNGRPIGYDRFAGGTWQSPSEKEPIHDARKRR